MFAIIFSVTYQEAAVAEFTSGYEGLKFFKKD